MAERSSGQSSADNGASAAVTLASGALALLVAGVGVFVLRGYPAWLAYVLWGLGGVALIAAAVLRRRKLMAVLRGREMRSGATTALLVMIVVGIAVLVNYVAARYHKRWDLTRARIHTLSPQSEKILRALRQPVEVIGFCSQAEDPGGYQRLHDLLREYESASRYFKARVVDPDLSPGLARQWGVTGSCAAVILAGERKEELFFAGEQEITGAVLRIVRTKRHKLYFAQGNGEHDLEGQDADGYSSLKRALTGLGYDVEALWLSEPGSVPRDCDVLVIGGPRRSYNAYVLASLEYYLDRGGKALIMVDPEPDGDPLAELLEPRGLKPLPGIVVEPRWNLLGDASSVTVAQFEDSAITRPFARSGRSLSAVFFLVRAFERDQEQPPSIAHAQDLVHTSDDSWIETEFRGTIRRNPGERRGPLTIAAFIEGVASPHDVNDSREPDGRLVVFGDSDFVANGFIANGANQDLFVNSIAWLAQAPEIISIRPKQPQPALALFTPAQLRVVKSVLTAMPLLVIVVGAIVWWRRR